MASPLDRPLPYNTDAEEVTLGSCMLDPEAIPTIRTFLKAEMFYRDTHRWVYEALLRLDERNEPIDQVTLTDELERQGKLGDVGGHACISQLLLRVPTAIHIEHYARIVERNFLFRQAIQAAENIARMAYEQTDLAPAELRLRAVQEVERLLVPVSSSVTAVPDHTPALLGRLEQIEQDGTLPTLPCAIPAMQALLQGYPRGMVSVWGGRTAVGKTHLGWNEACHKAQSGYRVVHLSTEMLLGENIPRVLAWEARLDLAQLLHGFQTQDLASTPQGLPLYPFRARSWAELRQRTEAACQRIQAWPGSLRVIGPRHLPEGKVDRPDMTATGVVSRLVSLARTQPVDLVVVDYLTDLDGIRGKDAAETSARISAAVRLFKQAAILLNAHVLLLTQLNREAAFVRYPSHDHFELSKKTADDADIAGTLIQPLQQPRERHEQALYQPLEQDREVLISKHRQGPTGIVSDLRLVGALGHYVPRAYRYEEEQGRPSSHRAPLALLPSHRPSRVVSRSQLPHPQGA